MKLAVVIMVPAVLGALFVYIGFYFWREGRDLRREGAESKATLLKKFRKEGEPSLGGLENYYITVAFDDSAGKTHVVDVRVAFRAWHMYREGATSPIVYIPGRPARARLGARWQQRFIAGLMLFCMIAGGLMIVGSAIFLAGVLKARSERMLPHTSVPNRQRNLPK